MESDNSSFSEIKESINELLSMFKDQVKQNQQSNMLLHILSSKIDLQSERLSSVEKSLEEIKERIPTGNKSSESVIISENLVEGDGDNEKVNVIKRGCGDINDDRGSAFCFGQQLSDFKSLVLKNVTDLGNVCIENTADVMMRLDEADKKVFSKFSSLVEATAEMKKVLKQIEDLDSGIKSLENTSNGYSENLKSLVFDAASKSSVLNEIKINIDKLVKSSNGTRDELMLKLDEHFNTASRSGILNQIKTNTDKQVILSKGTRDEVLLKLDEHFKTISEISRKTAYDASVGNSSNHFACEQKDRHDKQITRQYWSIIEQIITENQITREILLETRKTRDSYKCDFFVKDFSKLINSKKAVFSNLWYFDQLSTHLKGVVCFTEDGQVAICLEAGRNHRKCGLGPKKDIFVGVDVFAVMHTKKNWQLGSRSTSFDENVLKAHKDCWESGYGCTVATIPCEAFSRDGYIDDRDILILRYHITPKDHNDEEDYEDSESYDDSENYDDWENWCP